MLAKFSLPPSTFTRSALGAFVCESCHFRVRERRSFFNISRPSVGSLGTHSHTQPRQTRRGFVSKLPPPEARLGKMVSGGCYHLLLIQLPLSPSFAFNSSDLPASAHEHERAKGRERLLLKGLLPPFLQKGEFSRRVPLLRAISTLPTKSISKIFFSRPTRLFPSISPLRFCLRDPLLTTRSREVSLNALTASLLRVLGASCSVGTLLFIILPQ